MKHFTEKFIEDYKKKLNAVELSVEEHKKVTKLSSEVTKLSSKVTKTEFKTLKAKFL